MFPTHVGRLAIFDDYLFCGDVGSGSFGKARSGFSVQGTISYTSDLP